MPPALFFFLRIALGILGLLWFHIDFWIISFSLWASTWGHLSFLTAWYLVFKSEHFSIIYSHLYVKSKKVELIETESRMVVTRDWGCGELGRCC